MKNKIAISLMVTFFVSQVMSSTSDTITLYSQFLHKESKFVVITPSTYNSNSKNQTNQKYPVAYLLHGYSGNYSNWLKDAPQLNAKADELGMIIVTPDGGYGSWYFDSPIDPSIKYESYITQELLPYIDSHYPVIQHKDARAITGLSMGGHGALYLAIKHLDQFGVAGSVCGGVDFRPFPNNWDIKKDLGTYAENKQNWDDNVVVNVANKLKNKDLAIIFDCGLDDFFIEVNRSLHQKLMEMKIEHDYIERPGSHNKAYWSNSIDFQLLYFKKYFNTHLTSLVKQ
jgi:S-formylglutathione hydrolase FrmB